MEKRIQFENHAGEQLSGTLHLPEISPGIPLKCGVVLSHCFTCSRHTSILRRLAARLEQAGFAALRFDFSGNGQSEGDFSHSTFSKMMSEVSAAIRRLADEGVDWIGLLGHSLGASVSVLAAADEDKVRAVCAVAGRLSGTDMQRILTPAQQEEMAQKGCVSFRSRGRDLALSREFFDDAGQYDLPAVLRRIEKPLLVVHGERDEIIPVMEADLAARINPERIAVKTVPGADHMFSEPSLQKEIALEITRWFQDRCRV